MRKGYDFMLGTGYLPSCGCVGYWEQVIALWNWFDEVYHEQPLRTLPVIGLDANARLGTRPLNTTAHLGLIGPHGHQQENQPGREFRSFLQRAGFTAISTLYADAAGSTYYDSRGHSSRIDYILSTPYAAEYIQAVRVERKI